MTTQYETHSLVEKMCQINRNYFAELEVEYPHLSFKRIEKVDGLFVTSAKNRDTSNDIRIFVETQVKRLLKNSLSPFLSERKKSKLAYFSQNEDENCIYQLDAVKELQFTEEYAIQNIGHATQLIQIPHFNILTDPVFNDLSTFLYPEMTKSHPTIEMLPKIDIILISHNHRDHVDVKSLENLLNYHKMYGWTVPKIFVPWGDKIFFDYFGFDEVIEVEWYTKLTLVKTIDDSNKIVHFISIPADHRSGRYGFDHHRSIVAGWIVNPEHENVIFKFSGDTKSLTEHQQQVDVVLWHEIKRKKIDNQLPDIVCFEPSGPNYTRRDMNVTHQSTSYSALLKFIEATNLANLSGFDQNQVLGKMQTIMMHHNKFELGPDRFNEGLFVFKKLLRYLNMNEKQMMIELERQEKKLQSHFDRKKLMGNSSFISQLIFATLPAQTSLLTHSKEFIIRDIQEIRKHLDGAEMDREQMKTYLICNTIFPKIGQRLNKKQIVDSKFDIAAVNKYNANSSRRG